MAWIKVETQTSKKGEVLRIAKMLNVSRHAAFGMCVEFWAWADQETEDGDLRNCDAEAIDEMIGQPGFVDALCSVGWLIKRSDGLELPNWDYHNGGNTKKRLLATRREQRHRIKRSQEK